jgi:hypothetical protein
MANDIRIPPIDGRIPPGSCSRMTTFLEGGDTCRNNENRPEQRSHFLMQAWQDVMHGGRRWAVLK